MAESYWFLTVAAVLVAIFCSASYLWTITLSSSPPLPPGPRRWPIIENILDIPRSNMWLRFSAWYHQYGELVYLQALGRGILVLNSMEVIDDLLTDKANDFSDRPTFTMIGEMIGLDNSIPMLPYGPVLKQHRKLCHIALSQEAVKKYHSTQEDTVAMFLESLIKSPGSFYEELRLAAGRIIMSVTYGISIQSAGDIYISEAEKTMEMISKSTVPGAHLVDLLPFLRQIPPWVPLNTIHTYAANGRALLASMVHRPYEHVKHDVMQGSARASFVRDCLESFESDSKKLNKEEQEHLIIWAAGAMYGAGGESTFASILSFILAMIIFPEVQARIHQEVLSVTGGERLPNIQDRPKMPYVEASILEVLRWRPALPLSIARKTRRPVYYKGYTIPGNTIVIPNISEVCNDTRSGIPSSQFAPERHMKDHVKDIAVHPAKYAFGFGRRVCPGRYLGENNLFLLISGLTAAFKILPGKDVLGNDIVPNPEYTSGLVSHPKPYEVVFSCRSAELAKKIKEKARGIV